MVALIIIGVACALGLIVFLLRKYIPGLKQEDKTKPSAEEISKENINKMVVTVEDKNLEAERKKEKERKEAIKKIKKESLTEEEENRRIAEIEKEDYQDSSDDQE